MAIPPKYDDLGKEAKDVFGKGYGRDFEHHSLITTLTLGIKLESEKIHRVGHTVTVLVGVVIVDSSIFLAEFCTQTSEEECRLITFP